MKSFAMALAAVTLSVAATAAFAATDQKMKTTGVHSPESIECSKQADAKGLHGKERKKFRAKCKREMKPKASSKPTAAPAAKTKVPAATPNY